MSQRAGWALAACARRRLTTVAHGRAAAPPQLVATTAYRPLPAQTEQRLWIPAVEAGFPALAAWTQPWARADTSVCGDAGRLQTTIAAGDDEGSGGLEGVHVWVGAAEELPVAILPEGDKPAAAEELVYEMMNRNNRKPKAANHGKRPCSRWRRRRKTYGINPDGSKK